jgi:hypothetical protein
VDFFYFLLQLSSFFSVVSILCIPHTIKSAILYATRKVAHVVDVKAFLHSPQSRFNEKGKQCASEFFSGKFFNEES